MKKGWVWLICAALTIGSVLLPHGSGARTAAAAAPVKGLVYVDAQAISYISLRALDGFAGVRLAPAGDGRAVSVTRGEDTLLLTLGSDTAVLNGEPAALKAAPFVKGGSNFAPLSALVSAFGWTLHWEQGINAVQLTAPDGGQLRLPVAKGQHPADMKPVEQTA